MRATDTGYNFGVKSETAVTIKKGALFSGAMVAAGALVLSADGGDPFLGLLLFVLWVTSPYLVLYLISLLVERFTQVPGRYGVGWFIAVLMLGFTLLTYVGTFGDKSSTYGLIFIFIPLWLHLIGIGLYLLCIVLSWLVDWSQRRASS